MRQWADSQAEDIEFLALRKDFLLLLVIENQLMAIINE